MNSYFVVGTQICVFSKLFKLFVLWAPPPPPPQPLPSPSPSPPASSSSLCRLLATYHKCLHGHVYNKDYTLQWSRRIPKVQKAAGCQDTHAVRALHFKRRISRGRTNWSLLHAETLRLLDGQLQSMSVVELLSAESSATAENDAAGTQPLGNEEELLTRKSSLLRADNATYSGSPLAQQCTVHYFKDMLLLRWRSWKKISNCQS